LIVIPAGLILFDEMKKIWLEIRKMKKRKVAGGGPDAEVGASVEGGKKIGGE
jgi:hypothetical protein